MGFTDAGVLEIVKHMKGSTAAYPAHLGAGTTSVAFDPAQTALSGEVGDRYAVTDSSNINSVLYTGIMPSTDNDGETIREAGLFDTGTTTASVMFTRFVHSPIVKSTSVEIQYDVTVRILNVNW